MIGRHELFERQHEARGVPADRDSTLDDWPSESGIQLRFLEIECVNLLGAGVAHQQWRAVRSEPAPAYKGSNHPAQVLEADYALEFAIGHAHPKKGRFVSIAGIEVDVQDPGRVQGATVLGPGDFPIGSMQSRAAARLRLQKIGEVGKGSSECICFPEDEQPFFRTSEERDLAEGVQCPLHGKRFTLRFHIFVAALLGE
jgi:hypothetical protein